MRVGLLQLCASDDPTANLVQTRAWVAEAAAGGANLVLTPEVTNCVSLDRHHQNAVLHPEDSDPTLEGLRQEAAAHRVWLLIGSLALKSSGPEARFANRSFLIGPEGQIVARYDKLHMFDVQVTETETYRESQGFAPGDRAVVADAGGLPVGMTICYDVRFPALYRQLAQAGAQVLAVPAAFSPVTGAAHWEPLLRARAIECGAYVLAPAQGGSHAATHGRSRQTYGHSMVVDPWGRVVLDAGDRLGVHYAELDVDAVARARHQLPSLTHDRVFSGP